MALDGKLTPEQIKALTMHTSKAFERYFRPKVDYSIRDQVLETAITLADNVLTTNLEKPEHQNKQQYQA